MKTTVVNIKDVLGWQSNPLYVYIGRPGKGIKSEYGNPHKVGWCYFCSKTHNRSEAIENFRNEAKIRYEVDVEYRKFVEKLRNRHLVCFCAPKSCHGDVYVELLDGVK